MSEKTIIQTEHAPKAIGPYSQAVMVQNLGFISGQIAMDPQTGDVVSAEVCAQAEQVFKNLTAILDAAGCDLSHVVKMTVYLTDLTDFQMVNKVMEKWCQPPFPARAAVEVSRLPKDVKVEIEAIFCKR